MAKCKPVKSVPEREVLTVADAEQWARETDKFWACQECDHWGGECDYVYKKEEAVKAMVAEPVKPRVEDLETEFLMDGEYDPAEPETNENTCRRYFCHTDEELEKEIANAKRKIANVELEKRIRHSERKQQKLEQQRSQ